MHKLSRQIIVNKMAVDLELMADLRSKRFTSGSTRKVSRQLDVFLIQPTGAGKSDFSVHSNNLRHCEAEMCKVDRPCNFSSGFAYVRPSSLSEISRNKC